MNTQTTKSYRFSFNGRQAGAIGIFYKIAETYTCQTLSEAKSLLYEDYEVNSIGSMKCGSKEIDRDKFDKAPFISVSSHRERPRGADRATYA